MPTTNKPTLTAQELELLKQVYIILNQRGQLVTKNKLRLSASNQFHREYFRDIANAVGPAYEKMYQQAIHDFQRKNQRNSRWKTEGNTRVRYTPPGQVWKQWRGCQLRLKLPSYTGNKVSADVYLCDFGSNSTIDFVDFCESVLRTLFPGEVVEITVYHSGMFNAKKRGPRITKIAW